MVEAGLRLLTGWGLIASVGITAAMTPFPALAQIRSDETLGQERSVVLEDVVPGVDGIVGGATRGGNLFHSFQQFNVGEGRAAYFANPDGIRNILSRVTGSDPSNILGTLGVLGDANLFLINPNGIVFGDNAVLDVQGSFVATTANAVEFGDQGFFNATNPEAPALLSVNPSAFLFNQLPVGSITNTSMASAGTQPSGLPEFGLRVPDGENLLFVGGDIFMDGGRLNAHGGRVELTGLAAPGSIGLDMGENAFKLSVPANRALADITLANDARVSVRGTGGGDIVVNADRFSEINGGRLAAGTEGAGTGGTITVNANAIRLSGIGQSGVSSNIVNQSGDIKINAGSLTLQNDALIFTSNILTRRPPGEVQIRATEAVTLQNNSSILVDGAGDDGITINTPTLTAENDSEISILSAELEGRNGDITINAPGSVTLLNDSRISNTAGFDSEILNNRIRTSTSGNVAIETNRLTVAENSAISSTSVFTIGQSGDVTIRARDVRARDDSSIDAAAFGGSGGDVTITADRFIAQRGSGIRTTAVNLRRLATSVNPVLVVDENVLAARDRFVAAATRSGNLDALERGSSGDITIRATQAVELDDIAADGSPSFLATGSDAGDAGDIRIEAQTLNIRNGAYIESTTDGNGQGGDLNLTADSIAITGFTRAIAFGTTSRLPSSVRTTSNDAATGNAGNVTLQTDRLLIRDGAEIDTTANGQGRGGDIQITARESVDLIGATDFRAPRLRSILSSSSSSAGNAGNITIRTGQLRLRNGGVISAIAGATGQGGNITIRADAIEFSGLTADRQLINTITSSSSAAATGDAGNVTLTTGSLRIRDGGLILANTLGAGQGGNIRIAARDRIDVIGTAFSPTLRRASSGITTSSSGGGDAGNIWITADRLRVQDGGVLAAASLAQGQGGNLTITATDAIEVIGTSRSADGTAIRSNLTTDTTGTGNAGTIALSTDRLRIQDGATITANTNGSGAGGNIRIAADTVEIAGVSDDQTLISGISSTNTNRNASGNAGTIAITTDRLTLREGGQISAITLGEGQGGNLLIEAEDTIDVVGTARLANGQTLPSGLRTDTAGTGNAGNVTLSTDQLRLQDRGTIAASTEGRGTGGTIGITAAEVTLTEGATISAESRNIGQAGDINLEVSDRVALTNSRIITAANRSSGGAISVEAGDIRLSGNSNIQTNVNQGRETGGNIRLTADSIVAFDDSDILAFAQDGRGGNITLDTPTFFGEGYLPGANTAISELEGNGRVDVNASGRLDGVIRLPDVSFIQNSLAEIPDNTIDADQLIANSCIARNPSSGTFVITGSGGLPDRPGDGAGASYPTGEVRAVPEDRSSHQVDPAWQVGDPIVEPQGVFQLTDGRLVISRFCDRE